MSAAIAPPMSRVHDQRMRWRRQQIGEAGIAPGMGGEVLPEPATNSSSPTRATSWQRGRALAQVMPSKFTRTASRSTCPQQWGGSKATDLVDMPMPCAG